MTVVPAKNQAFGHFRRLSLVGWSCAQAPAGPVPGTRHGVRMAKVSSRYVMGETTRSEWENDMKEHRELLRNVIEDHREGRDNSLTDWSDIALELQFEEERVYAPVSALSGSKPPAVVRGNSGWIYHSTSLGCLKPYHWPRRLAINVVESSVFDPFILLTIMVNCTTMAWSSPVDPPGTTKQDILAVRKHPRSARAPRQLCPPLAGLTSTLRSLSSRLPPGGVFLAPPVCCPL